MMDRLISHAKMNRISIPMAIKPNLFILGAQKAGTSTLAQHLNKHEQIYMPARKELLFFNQDYSEINEAKYMNLVRKINPNKKFSNEISNSNR